MIKAQMAGHVPVMISEVLGALKPFNDGLFIDGTFGQGGYSEAILKAAAATVIGIDCDPAAVKFGEKLTRKYHERFTILEGRFGNIERLMNSKGVLGVNGIAFDLGVSSMQLNTPNRGFSFRTDGPLDMRMSKQGVTAADLVNDISERELSNILHEFGEERQARRIARAIADYRAQAPIQRTSQLAKIVRGVVFKSKEKIDPATRTFMALRIYVNDELGELRRGLCAAENILVPGGRLAIVAFHSLEDRIVKEFLYARSGRLSRGSRHLPDANNNQPAPSFKLIKPIMIKPSQSEIAKNPRSRSARLRVAERTDSPPWSYNSAYAASFKRQMLEGHQ